VCIFWENQDIGKRVRLAKMEVLNIATGGEKDASFFAEQTQKSRGGCLYHQPRKRTVEFKKGGLRRQCTNGLSADEQKKIIREVQGNCSWKADAKRSGSAQREIRRTGRARDCAEKRGGTEC